MTEKLKPCPFCGSRNVYHGSYTITKPHIFGADCDNCDAKGPIKDNKEDAAKAWNTRNYCNN